ncbi:caspase family protein [Nocardia sp. NPDC059240]|uniref:caspase, EACC1-associated type n=1 Tax=Nocardia sp. NPDC059240 TaxID=3346786 RepID=UPI003680079F
MADPDFTRSQAVLIGTSRYAELRPQLPSATNSLDRMYDLLTGPLCAWPTVRVEKIADRPNPDGLSDKLVDLFSAATDVALFYYVGHGQLDNFDQLCLSLVNSREKPAERRATTSLTFDDVRKAMSSSKARTKIVILDCCFSGRAITTHGVLGGVDVADLTLGTGAYTLAATGEYSTAWFETDAETLRPQTYFTKYLVELVERGVPNRSESLTLGQLGDMLTEKLAADGKPSPTRRTVDAVNDFPFARNAYTWGGAVDYLSLTDCHQTTVRVDGELYCVAFAPDGSTIAAGSGESAFVWDLPAADGQQPAHVLAHPRFVYSLAYSTDARTLVTGCEDGGVRFWDLATGRLDREELNAHNDAVYAVAMSGDGRYLATGSYDCTVIVWRLPGRTRVETWQLTGRVSSLAFPSSGNVLAIGTHDNVIHLWNLDTYAKNELGRHTSSVESVAFSRNGTRLASCGLDKTVCLWDVLGKSLIRSMSAHQYLVKSVAFSPDSTTIASASWDKTLRLWSVAGGMPQRIPWWDDRRFRWHSDWIWAVAFSEDGRTIATAGSDGVLSLLSFA